MGELYNRRLKLQDLGGLHSIKNGPFSFFFFFFFLGPFYPLSKRVWSKRPIFSRFLAAKKRVWLKNTVFPTNRGHFGPFLATFFGDPKKSNFLKHGIDAI